MKIKTALLTSISLFYITEQAKAFSFGNFIKKATTVVQNNIQQNPQANQYSQFATQQGQGIVQAQLSNAQNYISKDAPNLQTQAQNAFQQGGIGGFLNYATSEVGILGKGLASNAQTLAQQQQGTLQAAFTQDQINQIVQNLTDMDKQYGAQIQALNPQWRIGYVQTQQDLVSTPAGYTIASDYLVNLAKREIQAIPVIVAQKGALKPSDARWIYLSDSANNLYGLDGTSIKPLAAQTTQTTASTPQTTSLTPQTVPQTTLQTVPQTTSQTMPATSVPQTVPQTSVPQTIPVTSGPQTLPQTVPATSVPQTVPQTIPATSVPQTMPQTVPATSVPQTVPQTIPATSVPQTMPATSVPQTMPATSVPQTMPATSVSQQANSARAIQALQLLDNQYGTKIQAIDPSIRASYLKTLSTLQATAQTSPALAGLVLLAQREVEAVPTIVEAQGGLKPSGKDWQNLIDIQGNLYDLDGLIEN